MKNLCLAGGVALNCVANGRILRECPYESIFIQPAAGDAGGAVGVAYFIYNSLLRNERNYTMKDAFLGPDFTAEEIKNYLDKRHVPYRFLTREDLLKEVSRLIDQQHVIGWFQGRMEFGPRALGNRSIIADARNPKNKDIVNLKIKFRESFRPFAPTILEDKVAEYFELDKPSPYMLLVAQVRKDRRVIPSVTHVDGSARIQTIKRADNELYYDLIEEFGRQTGCPVIINTSFNVRGEPIICSPHDAFMCFMRTHMDYLVMDRFLLDKKDMPSIRDDEDWLKKFELD
jgi:carbamoyltransferase